PEPSTAEMLGTVALARLILGPEMSVQAPPNLAESPEVLGSYLGAGINDWGGVSPVTIDHVNPEAPWPEIEQLRAVTEEAGFLLVPASPSTPATPSIPPGCPSRCDPGCWRSPTARASPGRRAGGPATSPRRRR